MTSAGFSGWFNGWVHLAADGLLRLHAAGRVETRRGDERTDRGSVEQLVNRLSADTLSCYQGEPGSHSLLSASGLPGHFRVRGGRQVLIERLSRLLGLDPAEVQSLVAVPGGDLVVLLTEWEPEEGAAELASTERAVKSRLARGCQPGVWVPPRSAHARPLPGA